MIHKDITNALPGIIQKGRDIIADMIASKRYSRTKLYKWGILPNSRKDGCKFGWK